MGREEPLRISCDDCPARTGAGTALVEFFLAERNARIVRLGNDPVPTAVTNATPTSRLPSTPSPLGLTPQVVAHRTHSSSTRAS